MDNTKQYEETLEKHTKTIREVEAYLTNKGKQNQVAYTSEQIKKLAEDGYLPKELWDYHCQAINDAFGRSESLRKLKEENPNLSSEEVLKKFWPERQLTREETLKHYENAALGGLFLKFLLENEHLLTGDANDPNKLTAVLFKGINPNQNFGIERFMSDSIYHLEHLLKEMEVNYIHSTVYEAIGKTNNSKSEEIKLSYTFQANSEEEAASLLKEYKKIMSQKGLKIWMTHWLMANQFGKLEYACPMIEVMKQMSEEDRDAFFSTKEKEEHWAITRMLGNSKLRRERKVTKRGKQVVQWIEQPLLEIIGGEKEQEVNNKYPSLVAVRVLVPMDDKGFVPAIYKNSTIRLSPSDVFIAFKIQTRATQRGYGTKPLHFDWDFLFEAGNLQATAVSKKAVAKAQTRKKMDRLQQSEIIERWEETLIGMDIIPTRQKKIEKTKKNAEGQNTQT